MDHHALRDTERLSDFQKLFGQTLGSRSWVAHLATFDAVVERCLQATIQNGIFVFTFLARPRKEANEDSRQRVRDEVEPKLGYRTASLKDLVVYITERGH